MTEPKETLCTVAEELDVAHIQAIQRSSRHPRMKQMLYFVKLINPRVPRAMVQVVFRDCRVSINLQIQPRCIGSWAGFDVSENWSRVGMDVAHLGNQLSSTDRLQPLSFCPLEAIAAPGLGQHHQTVRSSFCEWGPLSELLTDSGVVFCGETLAQFAKVWVICLHFQCAHIPSGNGIIERFHHMIKCIVTKTLFNLGGSVLVLRYAKG